MNCDYIETGGEFICSVCGDRRRKRFIRQCGNVVHGDAQTYGVPITGVGSILTANLWRDYKIPSCKRCRDLAQRMNELGTDGCRAELTELAEQLQSHATRFNWQQITALAMHPVSTASGAFHAATEGLAFFESLILKSIEAAESTLDK